MHDHKSLKMGYVDSRIPALSMNAIKEGVTTSVSHNLRQGLGSTGSIMLAWKQIGLG